MNSRLNHGNRLALDADEAIATAFGLYLSGQKNAVPLDPASPNAQHEEAVADEMTWASRSLAEQIIETKAKSLRAIAMKLALAIMESDTGEGLSADATLQTRLTASAMRDAMNMAADASLSQSLARLRIY